MKKLLLPVLVIAVLVSGCGISTEKKVAEIEKKIEYVESRIDSVEARLGTIEEKDALMENYFKERTATKKAPAAAGVTADGMSNEDIQSALKNAGYYNGMVDGKIGPMTKKAIVEFQKANGLTADGNVDAETKSALLKKLC